jgi:hypothetical protein
MTGARVRKTAAATLLALAAAGVAAPGALDVSADKALSATGTVSSVQASARTVVVSLADGGEATFVWNTDTKITGVLTPGAKVTVRYVTGPNGRNLALQITVARS